MIRVLEPHEWLAASTVFRTSLLFGPPESEPFERGLGSYEAGATLGLFDGSELVGSVGHFTFEMTVPGGSRHTLAGVSRVGVLPTHTRRGHLRALMQAQLERFAAAGIPFAALRASEATIYGRFGYGPANEVVDLELDRARALLRTPPTGRVRLLARPDAVERAVRLHDRFGRDRPGSTDRPDWHRRWHYHDFLTTAKPHWIAVHHDTIGEPDGYVEYTASASEPNGFNDTLTIHDLIGADAAVELALWAHVLDVDLAKTVKAEMRPIDDPVRLHLVDLRAAKTELGEEIWLRLVDVGAALAARAYAGDGAVRVAVTDPVLPANTGTYLVSADGVTRTTAAADLELTVADLARAYLGGFSFTRLAAAGLVLVRTAGALAAADRLFAVGRAPWSGTFF